MSKISRPFIIVFGAGFLVLLTAFFFLDAPIEKTRESREFEVRPGESARSMASRLKTEGFIQSVTFFRFMAKLGAADQRLQKGLYLLNDNMSTLQILDFIARGRVYTIRVTIPEGFPVRKIAGLLVQKKLLQSEREFVNYAFYSNRLRERYRFIPGRNLEGFLYPDTYDFPKNTTAGRIALAMVGRFSNVVFGTFAKEVKQSGKSFYDVLRMASLVEKEAKIPAERPLISQVFWKRLNRGINMFCDPTVGYAVGKLNGERLRTRDLQFDSPFNTYLYPGLPPTPICSPGRPAIRAAIFPADSDYLYFVARNDGSHQFSRTLKEHNAAVDLYQKKKK